MGEALRGRREGVFLADKLDHLDGPVGPPLDGSMELFPLGLFVARRYVTEVLPAAKAAGVGTSCFKALGAGKLLGDTEGYGRPLSARPRGKVSSGGSDQAAPTLPRLDVATCLRDVLGQDPDVALLGLSFENEQEAAWEAAKDKGAVWWNPPPELGR